MLFIYWLYFGFWVVLELWIIRSKWHWLGKVGAFILVSQLMYSAESYHFMFGDYIPTTEEFWLMLGGSFLLLLGFVMGWACKKPDESLVPFVCQPDYQTLIDIGDAYEQDAYDEQAMTCYRLALELIEQQPPEEPSIHTAWEIKKIKGQKCVVAKPPVPMIDATGRSILWRDVQEDLKQKIAAIQKAQLK